MSADDDTAAILARSVRRVEMTVRVPAVLDRDDLMQEGKIALLLASYEQRSPAEVAVYRTKRATGAMLDAVRRARQGASKRSAEPQRVDLDDAPELSAAGNQCESAATLRAIRAVLSLAHPLPLLFTCVLAGLDRTQIAAHLGISQARVSQHMDTVRAALAEHLEVA